jgi:excinuclease ABC subunit A
VDLLHPPTDASNTVLVVEHNPDVITTAAWIIDLGPEGGDAGGRVLAAGAPGELARVKASHCGQFLCEVLRR